MNKYKINKYINEYIYIFIKLVVSYASCDWLSLVHTSEISIIIRTNKRQNKGMQSSLRHIERHKHKHKNIVEA